jgi:hypothetical protein
MVVQLVLAGIALLIIFQLRNVWLNYRVVGQLLDLLDVPGVQDRLFARPSNLEMLQKTVNRYVFLTRYVPVLIIGVFATMATMAMAVASGTGLTPTLSTMGSLAIAGAVVWLLNFEAVPHWLYEWHLTVLLTRSAIDLEAVTEVLESFAQRMKDGEYDNLTPIEKEYVTLQVGMMKTIHTDTVQMVSDLTKQQAELKSREG